MTTPVGEGAQSGAEGTQSGTGETTGTGEQSQTTGSVTQSGEQTPAPNTDAERARQEADSLRERMKAADRRAAEFEQQLKQLRDKDLPEVDKLKRDYEDSVTQVTKLQEVNKNLALKVAFLSDNTYSWHNPERALKLVDLSQVTIEEDGSVSGLGDALKALATSDDYLVKKEATTETPKPASTTPANNGGTGGSKISKDKLAARFPTMNTRRRA
jgi:membrane-associated HD superfamily phosphohydrolase